MAHDVLLIFCLLTCISVTTGQMSSVKYEVVDNKTTWKQAVEDCTHLNGTLIDASEYHDVNNISVTADSSYWTGNFKFMTKWVQLKVCSLGGDLNRLKVMIHLRLLNLAPDVPGDQDPWFTQNWFPFTKGSSRPNMEQIGCFSNVGTYTEVKGLRFEHGIKSLGWLCYMICYDYAYFGITDDICKCIPNHSGIITVFNKCPACNDSSLYQCGTGHFTAVYEIRRNFSDAEQMDTDFCASYNCQKSGKHFDLRYQGNACDEQNHAFCSNEMKIDSGTWMTARQKCEANDSYIFQYPVRKCTNDMVTPAWDNIHRILLPITTRFEVLNGLRIHNNHKLKQCSYISHNITEPGYDKCSSRQHGFICKIGTFTDDYPTSHMSYKVTEVEGSTTDTTNILDGDATTTTSKIGQRMENSNNEILYVAIGAGAGGFLVVIIIVICVCRKRSHKSKADETEGEYKEINVDEGEISHINAAERYITIKSEQASVEYTVENGNAATKTADPGKNRGEGYDQIVLPNEKPDCGLLDQGGADHVKQPSPDINETSNVKYQNTEEEDDYAEVDSESIAEGNIPDIHVQSASIKKEEIDNQQETEDDYDHFTQTDQRQSVSSNYDHVHLRNSQKSKKRSNQDDSEDYDHIPGAGGRREKAEVDSTYDHTQVFGLRGSTASMSSNYDHVVLLQNDRISDDYDHTTNVSRVEVADGDRDSNYTTVILPDSP